LTLKKDSFKFARQYSEENWNTFFQLLIGENWQEVFDAQNVDAKSEIFMSKLVAHFELAFPLKKIVLRVNQQKKVKLTEMTKQLQSRLLELNRTIKNETNQKFKTKMKDEFKSLRNYIRFRINDETRKTNDLKIKSANNKSSMAWKIVKESTGKNMNYCEIDKIQIDGAQVTDKERIVNILNEKFIEDVPVAISDDYSYLNLHADNNGAFELQTCTVEEILEIIKKLPSKTAAGWDGISVKVIKKISPLIANPLTHLVNCSFLEGIFPQNMKIAKINPLYKKGDKDDCNNYRPIAITSQISKVFEKAFLNRLQSYFSENNLLSEQQHGFRKRKSTLTALFDFITPIYESMENRERINVILYDFSNAFGSLYPQLLIRKLKYYGLCDISLSWLTSFLLNRKQYVQLKYVDDNNVHKDISSEMLTSNMGVPQGSVLGPFGFSAYTNDISLAVIIAILILFADDTTAVITGKTNEEANEKTSIVNSNIVRFADENLLKLNGSKTKILQMHTHQTRNIVEPNIFVKGSQVDVCTSGKLLGLVVNNNMSWSEHCDKVANKLRSLTFLFTILREKITEQMLKVVYYAYINSHILYSLVIWGGSSHTKKVFLAQKRVIRSMSGLRYWRSNAALDSCKPLFKKYNILTVYSLYILECMKFVKKFPDKFLRQLDVENAKVHETRSKKKKICENDLYVSTCSLDLSAENPNVMIPRIFNALPVHIKMIDDDKDFLAAVHKIVLHYQYYDMNEFFMCDFDLNLD
jgi:hypothetical protein